jgi:hypothetical protein
LDIFDVLTAISKRKMIFMQKDMNENDALNKAGFEISTEYHIPLLDIKKLLGVRFIPIGLVK